MNYLKMILANGEEIAIDSFSLPLHIVADRASKADALDVWQKLTPEALEDVTIFENGEKTAEFANVELTSAQFVMYEESDNVTVHFYMSGENRSSNHEDEYVTAAKILLGEEE